MKTGGKSKLGPIEPMEAKLVSELPATGRWQFEPKWDGFRCLIFRRDSEVTLQAKSGKPLTRFFPEVVAAVLALKVRRFLIDGELLIPKGKTLSFADLQARLHPAQTRIDRLARETPALFMAFDLLKDGNGKDFLQENLTARRSALEALFAEIGPQPRLRLSPVTDKRAVAKGWLGKVGGGALDGIIAKPLDEPYQAGERAMLKIKCLRSADCVIGGFRYATGSRQVGSMLLGLYNSARKLDHVGFTSGIPEADRPILTKKLEKLRGGEGFSGDAPGGPSRWSTERSAAWEPLKPTLVAEVQYVQVTGDRFRHGTRFLRWRPDKSPQQCTLEQLQRETRPSKLLRQIFG